MAILRRKRAAAIRAAQASERRCLVCSSPLPEQTKGGRPRKVCRDEDSPTPGGCARWRDLERRMRRKGRRPSTDDEPSHLYATFPDGGFIIERVTRSDLWEH